MKIGILGAGNVGGRLGRLLEAAGHDVALGARSGETSLDAAAAFGEFVIVALPHAAIADAVAPLANVLARKIVVDASNPVGPDWRPVLLGEENSAGEELAKLLPNATVVKAFNTVFADIMTPDGLDRQGRPTTVFVASDDARAVAAVSDLARSIGFAPVGIEKLEAARHLEALAHLNIELAVGQGGGTNAAFVYDRA